ncbi:hypothetical protein HH212_16775 [Massilia forsythiae]|uniref:Hemerythrin-like domain-containing protein n=1 Tax=Massilia forsythiae TaxID=2728020 RepID=A0A7Z2ZTD8_9BURK|nr:hemerythrin domain-containing protein [Massilia forsythiae]QJE01483.1 hypothetical protein HH212_16775 [Massilia forsythiae]
MLTSTYTLVALSVEQNKVRAALHSLLQELHVLPGDLHTLATGRAAQLCAGLRQAYDSCHWRKLDKFLVPALRRHTAVADGLLQDLEELSRAAWQALDAAEACIGAAERAVPRVQFCGAVERCVAALRRRLEREEHELFPLARSAVGGDAWFAIANQMLAHDAHARERRGTPRGGRLARDPVAAEGGRRHAALSALH